MEQRIFVIEDEPEVHDLLRAILSEGPRYAVDGTHDARDALSHLRSFSPHCLLLDLMLGPGPSGLELCRQVRDDEQLAGVGILVVSGRIPQGAEHRVLLNGADLCLHKSVLSPAVLLDNVAALLQIVENRTSSRITRGALTLDTEMEQAWVDQQPVQLTAMQRCILRRLLMRPRHVWSPSQLLASDASPNAARRLARVQVARIRKQFGAHASLIKTVRGKGYFLDLPPD